MPDGSDLVIVVPLWRRTVHIDRVARSAMATTPEAHLLFVASVEDHAVTRVLEDRHYDHVLLPGPGGGRGDYATKINAGYRASTAPFIFTGADDLDFHAEWYDAARALMPEPPITAYPPDAVEIPTEAVGVVGTADLCNGRTMTGAHSTHSLVARWYADLGTIDEPQAIYHGGYYHEYCDDELCETARYRGAWAHATDAVVEHLHPNIGKSAMDETYRRGRQRTQLSRKLFMDRQPLWGARPRHQARQVYARRPRIEKR